MTDRIPHEDELPAPEQALAIECIEAMQCAFRPRDLDPREHEALVAEAIELSLMSDRELHGAQALRRELEQGHGEGAILAEALRSALSPTQTDTAIRAAIAHAESTLAKSSGETREVDAPLTNVLPFRRRHPQAVLFGLFAAAAALVLFIRTQREDLAHHLQHADISASLVPARSTQELFKAPFAANSGRGEARIDRIAAARTNDFRHNRFARWGVK